MRKAFAIISLLLLIILVVCAIMIRNADADPIERDVTVEVDGLPPGTRPIRIALLSDFHVASFGNTPARFNRTARRVTALRPDLILLAGDFESRRIPGGNPVAPSVRPIAEMKARLGVFAVLGNHDYGHRYTFYRALKEHGARLLNNEAAAAGPLAIVGIGDSDSRRDKVPVALRSLQQIKGVPIILTHSPDVVPELPAAFQLVLAGHTHCGQVVLPLIGSMFTSSRYGRRYLCGVILEGRRTIVVSSGLGISRLPFRLGAPPDFWVITIKPRRARG